MYRAFEPPVCDRALAWTMPAAVALWVLWSVSPAIAQTTHPPSTQPEQLTEAQKTELATFSKWLRDDTLSADNRKQAATLLLNKGWEAAEAVLLEVLSNKESPAGRLAVADALAAYARRNGHRPSDKFVPALLAALADTSQPLRSAAARALAGYKDLPDVVARLRELALDPAGPIDQRRGAIAAFSGMPPSHASIDALIAVLADKDPELRARAMEALNRLTWSGLTSVAAWNQWWAKNKDKSPLVWVNQLNQRLTQENHELRQQRERLEKRLVGSLDALYQTTPEPQQADVVLKYLSDSLAAVRVLGLRLVDRMIGLGRKVPEPVKKAVTDRLTDESAEVRAAAADVIAYLADPKAASQLLAQLAVETDVGAKIMIVKALGPRLRAAEATEALLRLLAESKDRAVTAESAMALGAIAAKGRLNKEAVEPVAAALLERYRRLGPDEALLRDAAIAAMADIADARFIAIFLKSLADESASVRLASACGLGNVAPLPAGQPDLQNEVIEALVGRLPSESDRGVRLALITALGKFGPGRGLLDAIYARTNPNTEADESVRKRAWDTLIELLKSADKTAQLAWARQLEASPDAVAGQRVVDLLLAVEANAKPDQWTAEELQSLTERLADALMRVKRPAEAVARLGPLYQKCLQEKSPRTDVVAAKYFGALLAANQVVQAIDVLKQRQKPGMAEAILKRIRSLLEGNSTGRAATALALVQEIRRKLPQASKTAPWAGQLKQLADDAAQAYAAQLPGQIGKALDQMAGTDPAVKAAARKRIEQTGAAALPILLDELARAIEAGEPARPREQAIVSLLTGPPIDAKDWDPAAPIEKKKALLAAYRQRLKAGAPKPD